MSDEQGDVVWHKKGHFGQIDYGPAWTSGPAVAITRSGLTLNKLYVQLFNVRAGDRICIGYSVSRKELYIKEPESDEETQNSQTLQSGGKNRATPTLWLSASWLSKKFPDTVGKCFVATLNRSKKFVEVHLEQEKKDNENKVTK
jgi:hypothetical protein